MQEAGPPVPGHAVTALPGPSDGPMMRQNNSLSLGVCIEPLIYHPFHQMLLLGKNMGLLGLPLGMSAGSCGNQELFFFRLLLKVIEKMMLGSFSPHCFLSFALHAACLVPKDNACTWCVQVPKSCR